MLMEIWRSFLFFPASAVYMETDLIFCPSGSTACSLPTNLLPFSFLSTDQTTGQDTASSVLLASSLHNATGSLWFVPSEAFKFRSRRSQVFLLLTQTIRETAQFARGLTVDQLLRNPEPTPVFPATLVFDAPSKTSHEAREGASTKPNHEAQLDIQW